MRIRPVTFKTKAAQAVGGLYLRPIFDCQLWLKYFIQSLVSAHGAILQTHKHGPGVGAGEAK